MTTLSSWIWPVALAPVISSFLGVVVTRAESPRSSVFGRSCCAACGVCLGVFDLRPILSWLARCGRCRLCQRPIAIAYSVLEFAAVGVAKQSATVFSGWLRWATGLLSWTLLPLAAIDFKLVELQQLIRAGNQERMAQLHCCGKSEPLCYGRFCRLRRDP